MEYKLVFLLYKVEKSKVEMEITSLLVQYLLLI